MKLLLLLAFLLLLAVQVIEAAYGKHIFYYNPTWWATTSAVTVSLDGSNFPTTRCASAGWFKYYTSTGNAGGTSNFYFKLTGGGYDFSDCSSVRYSTPRNGAMVAVNTTSSSNCGGNVVEDFYPSYKMLGGCMPYVRRLYYKNEGWGPSTAVSVVTANGFDKNMVDCSNGWKFQMIAVDGASTGVAFYQTSNSSTYDNKDCAAFSNYGVSVWNQGVYWSTVQSNNCNGGVDNGASYAGLTGIAGSCAFRNCDSNPCLSSEICTDYINSFTCSPITCPVDSSNSIITWPKTNASTTATVPCNSGYYGVGQRSCNSTGSWGTQTHNCTSCECGGGSVDGTCNGLGQCTCKSGFTGTKCNQCLPNFFGLNCTACPSCLNGTCNSGYYGNGTCSCSPGWALGTNGVCNICAPGRYGNSCADECPNCNHGSCSEGTSGTGSCSCESGWGDDGPDHCVACLDGYTKSGGSCVLCHSTCETCNGTGFNECLTCVESLSFDISARTCSSNCSDGQYQGDGECVECDESCGNCIGAGTSNCTTCPIGDVFQPTTGSCQSSCPPQTFNSSGICLSCSVNCQTCHGGTQTDCDTCVGGRVLDNGSCLTSCSQPNTYTLDGVCHSCDLTCESCSGIGSSNCTSCASNMILSSGSCIEECPSGQINVFGECANCASSCKECSGTGFSDCTACESDQYLEGSRCTNFCGNYTFSTSTSIPCAPCNCSGLSDFCSPFSGVCGQCQHFATGNHCEQCLSGYERNPDSIGCRLIPTVPIPTSKPTSTPSSSAAPVDIVPIAIGAGVGGGLLFLGLIGLAVVVYLKRSNSKLKKEVELESLGGTSQSTTALLPGRRPKSELSTHTDTILNTTLEIALPGYLVIDPVKQIRVEKHVAGGGGGAIYTATLTDPILKEANGGNALVAVKETQGMDKLTDEENAALFKQEVSVMAALMIHPNVVKLIGFSDSPRLIVLPLYEGDLHEYIVRSGAFEKREKGPIPIEFKVVMISQIVESMQAVHSLGIIHRDLKTKNLLLEATPGAKFPYNVRLTDFGICRVIQDQGVKSQNFLNIFGISTKYAAPEVFSRGMLPNANVDAEDEKKADVYSFAICAWELLTEKTPWEGKSADEIQRLVSSGSRPPLDQQHSNQYEQIIHDLIVICWAQSIHTRPHFKEIRSQLLALGVLDQ